MDCCTTLNCQIWGIQYYTRLDRYKTHIWVGIGPVLPCTEMDQGTYQPILRYTKINSENGLKAVSVQSTHHTIPTHTVLNC